MKIKMRMIMTSPSPRHSLQRPDLSTTCAEVARCIVT
jgi:hypothetical protein